MFTGIVEDIGIVKKNSKNSLSVLTKLDQIKKGDSISVNGVCLTITEVKNEKSKIKSFITNISEETLKRTNLGLLKINEKVNLERAMKINDRLAGHILTGHIDTTTKIMSIKNTRNSNEKIFEFFCPEEFRKYITEKGSIAIDGISLTVADLLQESFTVAIVPFTLINTNLQFKKVGDSVNIEFDIISKYLEKLLKKERKKEITFEELKRVGFL